MPSEEKIKRNIQIYLEKTGLASTKDRKPTNSPRTYRALSKEYKMSIQRVLFIVNRMRKYYA